MSHNRTHHTLLARRLDGVTDIGYQPALQAVRAAAENGSLPDVLDDAGMAEALTVLTEAVTRAKQQPEVSSAGDVDDLVCDTPDGVPRYAKPGPHADLNTALLSAGIVLPLSVDYRPDGTYRVWRDGQVALTAREWPLGTGGWMVELPDDREGPAAGVGGATVDEVAAAMVAAVAGQLSPQLLSHLGIGTQHVCDDHCRRYRFFAREWCVTHAMELIDSYPTAAVFIARMVITSLDEHIGLAPLEPNTGRFQLFPIDTEAAKTADLSVPLIAIRLLDEEDQYATDFFIDGWERVYRARTEGRDALPAYQLSDWAERAVRREAR